MINKLWALKDADILPIFGICLGFQSLALAHGGDVKRLSRARHGIISKVQFQNDDIFAGIEEIYATQYHSLRVDLGTPREDLPPSEIHWDPTATCPSLCPLAWDTNDEVNGPILMGLKHTEKPFWGVQFHPESICTSKGGVEMVQNWWKLAKAWLSSHQRRSTNGRKETSSSTSAKNETNETDEINNSTEANGTYSHQISHLAHELQSATGAEDSFLRWAKHPSGGITSVALCEALGLNRDEIVMLDSQGHASGRYSILGVIIPGRTMKVTYKVWDRTLRYGTRPGDEFTMQLESIDEVWPILQEALDLHEPRKQQGRSQIPAAASQGRLDGFVGGHLPVDSPFWGGFMGYISYEAGLETIQVDLHESCAAASTPDINFAFVHRSIVIDHVTSQIYVQSLLPDDWAWILDVGMVAAGLVSKIELNSPNADLTLSGSTKDPRTRSIELQEKAALEKKLKIAKIKKPDETEYRAKVIECQEALAAGDSYELCLTDSTIIEVPSMDGKSLDPWTLYKKLRRKNPAPFGAFLRLSDAVVVGSSPERFLSWDRRGHCQFRPIKGTVKKSADVTREQAHSILNSSKERAENLMIVDLIRHDLSGVVGAENCKVSKLMVIEEYETVYQLVSVIEGQLPESSDTDGPRGMDVLKASLPPGSMTGAPRKRSCEILRDIEKRPRGIYSGVLGYMDVGGAGDFSVVIRTAVRESNVSNNNMRRLIKKNTDWLANSSGSGSVETWRIGAGGAITIQSTDEAEFLEMEVKASSALTTFQVEEI